MSCTLASLLRIWFPILVTFHCVLGLFKDHCELFSTLKNFHAEIQNQFGNTILYKLKLI
jgi:hypothetical protein